MPMPRRTKTRTVCRSLGSARVCTVSGRHFLLKLARVVGGFEMKEGCVRLVLAAMTSQISTTFRGGRGVDQHDLGRGDC